MLLIGVVPYPPALSINHNYIGTLKRVCICIYTHMYFRTYFGSLEANELQPHKSLRLTLAILPDPLPEGLGLVVLDPLPLVCHSDRTVTF